MNKRALIVVTSHGTLGTTGKKTGWYLPEVTHVYYPLIEAGYAVDFASPKGGVAPLDESSLELDDALNRRFYEDKATFARLERTAALGDVRPEDYGIIFFAGGHGTMWDFADDPAVARITAAIYEAGGIVAAVCHGPAALVNVRLSNGRYLVDGKRVNSFTNAEEDAVGLTHVVPFALETRLRERGADFHAGAKWSKTVVVSERLVTGQNPQSASSVGQAIVETARAVEAA
jgi:putative intracellular protease/amidase